MMDIGLKAFYPHLNTARRSVEYLQERGVNVKDIKYYRKGGGKTAYFNARANVLKKMGRWAAIGFVLGFFGSFILTAIMMYIGVIQVFSEINALLTLLLLSTVGGVFWLAVLAAVGVIASEDKVDISHSDFENNDIVVDMHISLKDGAEVDKLLKESGADNIISE